MYIIYDWHWQWRWHLTVTVADVDDNHRNFRNHRNQPSHEVNKKIFKWYWARRAVAVRHCSQFKRRCCFDSEVEVRFSPHMCDNWCTDQCEIWRERGDGGRVFDLFYSKSHLIMCIGMGPGNCEFTKLGDTVAPYGRHPCAILTKFLVYGRFHWVFMF